MLYTRVWKAEIVVKFIVSHLPVFSQDLPTQCVVFFNFYFENSILNMLDVFMYILEVVSALINVTDD